MSDVSSKILVVDDTEATRYAIARTLKANGYQIIEARDGRQALELAQTEQPDLITLDIHLPDILGFEVCRRIKTNPKTAQIPVLQVSASYVTSKDRIHGLEGGADSYLTHPFEPPVLIATVKALLRTRKLNEDLRLSEEKFRVALKNAPIMIFTCNAQLIYTWVYNPVLDISVATFVGHTDADIFCAEDAEVFTQLKVKALQTKRGVRDTMSLNSNTSTFSFDVTIEPFFAINGDVLGLTIACIDITERMRAETAQRTAAEDARLANQAKTRFLSNMSHEIRTPLGVIQGFADLALDESIPELERHEYLLTIKRNAHSLTKLLGEILDLSKIEADKIEIEKTRFSLTEVVQDVISALSLQAKEKGIGLSFRSEQPFPEFITSDPTRIRQIFINLISNAIKFTSHGHVEVVARLRKNLNPYQTSYIEFNVKDTGIGLTEEQKLRLFQAFSQADSSTTRKFGGTGLGLSLSKKLAYILGGDLILVESQIDEGSTFQFFFDAGILQPTDYRTISSSVSSFSAHIPVVSDELLGLNILLVEDSIDNQMLFSKYLTRFGASVDVASDGMEGVERARKSSYDVILMDVQMPNLDGYGAVSALHSAGITTPILALTAHATKDERDRAMNSGFSGYLTKPLSQIQLLEALSKYNKK